MSDLVKLFRALCDPTRLRILEHLAAGDLCVGALARRLGVTPSAVSQHLRVLREAGMVNGDKRGYWVHYGISRERADAAREELSGWLGRLCSDSPAGCPQAACPRQGRPGSAIPTEGGSTHGRSDQEV